MITKIREKLYLGDSASSIGIDEPSVTFDLRGWDFDLNPMKNDSQHIEVSKFVGFITRCKDSNLPVLVKCHGGIDRSPFLVACFLMIDDWINTREYNGMKFYEEVKKLHPATFIHDDWMKWYMKG